MAIRKMPDFTTTRAARPGLIGKCSVCNTDTCGPRAGFPVFILGDIRMEGPFEVGGRCIQEAGEAQSMLTVEKSAALRATLEAAEAAIQALTAQVASQEQQLDAITTGLAASARRQAEKAAVPA